MSFISARTLLALAGATCCTLASVPAAAVELNWSGFATLGYARSDSPYTYLGSIHEDGSFRRDTLVAGQADLRFRPEWSATVQAEIAPDRNDGHGWRARTAWAFVAWRPDNDWLLRLGKARVPLYLFSESQDIGVGSDLARMPAEQYSIAPTSDFKGLFVTRTATLGEGELGVEAYGGRSGVQQRIWFRDGLPGVRAPGAFYQSVEVDVGGLVLTLREPRFTWRLGVHTATTRGVDGAPLPAAFPRVEVAPGIGYWQVSDALPGPGVHYTNSIQNMLVAAGAEWRLAPGWRVIGEYLNMRQRKTEVGAAGWAGYLALFKRIGDFTPYVSIARQKSRDELLRRREQLLTPGLPATVPGAGMINAAQRMAGEGMIVFDQRSAALGVSYALSPTAKLKAEWMRTSVGRLSSHFEPPPGQPDASGLRVNTLSASVSVAF